ncbi:hypothetical protein [Desulfurobacterium sp.]
MLPSEVKKLAQYLWDNKIKIANTIKNMEVVERNIVGRFYYYVYLEVRESLKVNLLKEHKVLIEEGRGVNLHCILPETLKVISMLIRNQNRELSLKFKVAADSLRDLRKLRNDCDYKTNIFVDNIACQIAANKVSDILPVIVEIPNLDRNILGESVEKAIEICQESKKRLRF